MDGWPERRRSSSARRRSDGVSLRSPRVYTCKYMGSSAPVLDDDDGNWSQAVCLVWLELVFSLAAIVRLVPSSSSPPLRYIFNEIAKFTTQQRLN